MLNPFDDEQSEFLVLINDEGQFSLWPAWKEVPGGWRAVGSPGTKRECLAYVDKTWLDMRPNSLIREMDALKAKSTED